jgi:hypothetical protein
MCNSVDYDLLDLEGLQFNSFDRHTTATTMIGEIPDSGSFTMLREIMYMYVCVYVPLIAQVPVLSANVSANRIDIKERVGIYREYKKRKANANARKTP